MCSNKEVEFLNENHVIEKLKLNKLSSEDVKNLAQVQIQQYLRHKFNIQDEEQLESQLFCDEAPLSSLEMNNSQVSLLNNRLYFSQPNNENPYSQNSFYENFPRKQSDFGISNPNSIQSTPMKARPGMFGMRVNPCNLTSPCRYPKNEAHGILNNFFDKNDTFASNYPSSPYPSNIIMGGGKVCLLNNFLDLLFNEMESTNYYSNITSNSWQKD